MISQFRHPKGMEGEQIADALIDCVKLKGQMDDFCDAMCAWIKLERQPDAEVVSSSGGPGAQPPAVLCNDLGVGLRLLNCLEASG
jgi:hypothetical protein